MCNFFGLFDMRKKNVRRSMINQLIQGLRDLETWPTTSAGICVMTKTGINLYDRVPDSFDVLQSTINKKYMYESDFIDYFIGMSHSRVPIHGEVNVANTHPIKSDPDGTFIVVHKGFVLNFENIKKDLKKQGFVFETDTDTEAIAKLFLKHYNENKNASFADLAKLVVNDCREKSSFIVVSPKFPEEMIAVQDGCHLAIGILNTFGELQYNSIKKCFYLQANSETSFIMASDQIGFKNFTSNIVYGNTGDIFHFTKTGLEIYNVRQVDTRSLHVPEITNSIVEKQQRNNFLLQKRHIILKTWSDMFNPMTMSVKTHDLQRYAGTFKKTNRVFFVCSDSSLFNGCSSGLKTFRYLTGMDTKLYEVEAFNLMYNYVEENSLVFFFDNQQDIHKKSAIQERCKIRNAQFIHLIGDSTIPVTKTATDAIKMPYSDKNSKENNYLALHLFIITLGLQICEMNNVNNTLKNSFIINFNALLRDFEALITMECPKSLYKNIKIILDDPFFLDGYIDYYLKMNNKQFIRMHTKNELFTQNVREKDFKSCIYIANNDNEAENRNNMSESTVLLTTFKSYEKYKNCIEVPRLIPGLQGVLIIAFMESISLRYN